MNDDSLDEVFRAARAHPPDVGRAEFALETRVLAAIRGGDAAEDWLAWARRLVPYTALGAAGMLVWVAWSPPAWDADGEPVPESLAVAEWGVMP